MDKMKEDFEVVITSAIMYGYDVKYRDNFSAWKINFYKGDISYTILRVKNDIVSILWSSGKYITTGNIEKIESVLLQLL